MEPGVPPPGHQCPPDPSHLASIWLSVTVAVLLKFKLLPVVPWDLLRKVTMLLLDHPDPITHLFLVGKSLIPKYGSRQIRNCVQNISILDSKIDPYMLTNLVRGQLEHSI